MRKIKNNFEWVITLIIMIIIIILGISISSCGGKPRIDSTDTVEKCVVDSFCVTNNRSTIEPDFIYQYHTSCGYTLITKRNDYKVGDTITYIFKSTK